MTVLTDEIRAACEGAVGRTRTAVDPMPVERARQLEALLGSAVRLVDQDPLPPLSHLVYFQDVLSPDEFGPDGHEAVGRFLPAAPYSRRMWAAGRYTFHGPLRIGVTAERTSTIMAVTFKSGRSGDLCFVEVVHTVRQDGSVALEETQTIVYRDRGAPVAMPQTGVDGAAWCSADARTLFRYSALTYNGHRIHYDAPYCRSVEGYPDLVVHGPLLATRLARRAAAGGRRVKAFAFRALAPVFAGVPFRIMADAAAPGTLTVERADGVTAMSATYHDESGSGSDGTS